MDDSKIIFTGGKGLLGSTFRKLRPGLHYTDLPEFDVTEYSKMKQYVESHPCEMIIHAAAFTSPPLIDKNPLEAIQVNIIGTANVVRLCIEKQIRLLYISTDYVFRGDKGNYREEDSVYPVNKYAWSKLGGECAVQLYDNSLIVRTTFGPDEFPYEKAFVDQWTSRESVTVIAGMITKLIDTDATGVVHVGGKRKTVHEYAQSLDPSKSIGELSIHDMKFNVPVDTSLRCDKYVNSVQNKGT